MRRSMLLLFLVLTVACGSSPTAPSVQNVHSCAGGTLSGTMSATVNGTQFVATCLDTLSVTQGVISFGGTNVTQNNLTSYIDIAMAVQATAPGTFQLGNKTPNNAGLSIGGSQIWQAGAASTGTGTIVISVLSASRLSGTFTFDMVAGPGATGTKTVRAGVFDFTF